MDGQQVVPDAGRYTGNIMRSKVDVTKNGCTQFVAVLNLTHFEGRELVAPYRPTAYLMLTCTDGSRNIAQMDSLMAALGWDGKSLKLLHMNDWSEKSIEAVLSWDEYDGKRKLQVDWINAPGGGAALKPTDPSVLDQLEASWQGVKTGEDNTPF